MHPQSDLDYLQNFWSTLVWITENRFPVQHKMPGFCCVFWFCFGGWFGYFVIGVLFVWGICVKFFALVFGCCGVYD